MSTVEAKKIEAGTGVAPSVVAAVTAALITGGYLKEGEEIKSIHKTGKKQGEMNRWKKSGVAKQMIGRDLSIDFRLI